MKRNLMLFEDENCGYKHIRRFRIVYTIYIYDTLSLFETANVNSPTPPPPNTGIITKHLCGRVKSGCP